MEVAMAETISLTATAPEAGTRGRQHSIRRLSRALGRLLTLLFVLSIGFAAGIIAVGLFTPSHLFVGAKASFLVFDGNGPVGAAPLSAQPMITRLAGAVDMILATLPVAFVLWHLRALFRLYAAGTVFARANASHLKHIGVWLILYMPAKFIANMIFQAAGGLDHAWFHASEAHALILGAIVLVIAQVMDVGRETEQERAEFV
jgi:hypothetical protein